MAIVDRARWRADSRSVLRETLYYHVNNVNPLEE